MLGLPFLLASISLTHGFSYDDNAVLHDHHFLSEIYQQAMDKAQADDYQEYNDGDYYDEPVERMNQKYTSRRTNIDGYQPFSQNGVEAFSGGKSTSHSHEHKHTNDHKHAHKNAHEHTQEHKHKAVHTHIHKHDHHHEHNHHHKHAADHQHEQDHKHAHDHKHKHH